MERDDKTQRALCSQRQHAIDSPRPAPGARQKCHFSVTGRLNQRVQHGWKWTAGNNPANALEYLPGIFSSPISRKDPETAALDRTIGLSSLASGLQQWPRAIASASEDGRGNQKTKS